MSRPKILTELLRDDAFKAWVLSDGKENHRYWETWLMAHPEHEDVIYQAKAIILELQTVRDQLVPSRKEALRQKITGISQSDQTSFDHRIPPSVTGTPLRRWLGVAAAFLVLVVSGVVFYRFGVHHATERQFATTYGEIKTITLPDSTQVTLNGNSSLRYLHPAGQENSPREVWLEGEAFFAVSQRQTLAADGRSLPTKFIVYTGNLSVQVLGTRFNVRHRRDQTQVVLEEGKVQLELEDQDCSLLMSPDELVEVHKGQTRIGQLPVKAEDYTAWKEGLIHFEGASFSEISQVLADNYDLRLHFHNQELADDINLRGAFPAHRIDVLLEAIANVTHTTIRREGRNIIYQ